MSDDEPNIPAVPDIMRGEPLIDVEDPLLPAFSFQFDMRERFMQAMREAVEILREIDTIDPEHIGATLEKIELARSLLDRALDPEEVKRWNTAGRPLPSIPDVIARRGQAIDGYVGALYASVGLSRFNVWAYDPQNDYWSKLEEGLNADEAREVLVGLEANQRIGAEYLMVPVDADPNYSTI